MISFLTGTQILLHVPFSLLKARELHLGLACSCLFEGNVVLQCLLSVKTSGATNDISHHKVVHLHAQDMHWTVILIITTDKLYIPQSSVDISMS